MCVKVYWKSCVFLILSLTSLAWINHPFYISNTIAQFNSRTGTLQISSHLFVDDLELAIEEQSGISIKYASDKEYANKDSLIEVYLKRHLILEHSDTVLNLNYIGSELSEDYSAVWCYLESPVLPEGSLELEITNHLLMEIFPSQKNIFQIDAPDNSDYFLFRSPKQTESTILEIPKR